MRDRILVRNARQHNLKGIDLELPRRALIVITGPSGSGKSSLAFDTIYAEGQRRYVESLSTYAKQFLERMEKPAVDAVEGISPSVAIEQKNPTRTSRSTVGTATEVYDYLRLLWARAGTTHCPECGDVVRPDSVQAATDEILALPEGTRILVGFPLPPSTTGTHESIVENLRALGFVRVFVGGRLADLTEPDATTIEGFGHDLGAGDEVNVVVDRLVVRPDARERLADALNTAFQEGEGEALAVIVGDDGDFEVLPFTQRFRCPRHPGVRFFDPSPRLFSFNNPYGSCPTCTGFGATLEYDPALIVPVPERSLRDGAVDPWEKPRYGKYRTKLLAFARERGVPTDRPWAELPEDFRDAVIHGTRGFTGVIPFLRSREEKRYKQYIRVFLRQYQSSQTCRACGGARLRPEALWVRVAGRTIAEINAMTVADAAAWVEELGAGMRENSAAWETIRGPSKPEDAASASSSGSGSGTATITWPDSHAGPSPASLGPGPLPFSEVAAPILREITARLSFLNDVGLGYLTLDRQTRTLSGGESQRIALANALGSRLVDTLYVLDEPTIGLHPRDTNRLLKLLQQLRTAGNTVLVVEHDPAAIEVA
ncbi:MAG TPA: hypothetical protein VNZ57_05740, partial [Longimicrobiales bacterium]|nr:hypothetical protein [Longimicrobiales bacterium]